MSFLPGCEIKEDLKGRWRKELSETYTYTTTIQYNTLYVMKHTSLSLSFSLPIHHRCAYNRITCFALSTRQLAYLVPQRSFPGTLSIASSLLISALFCWLSWIIRPVFGKLSRREIWEAGKKKYILKEEKEERETESIAHAEKNVYCI